MSSTSETLDVIIITGPTASGKSAAATCIASMFGGTVINADSMQIYRELRILTARPSAEDEALVPHRLYGILSAADHCSAGRWREMAISEIVAAHAVGSIPVLVGGTGFYIKALLEGLSPIPGVPSAIREGVRGRLAELGASALFSELAARDPGTAARIAPSDTQRLLRGLEVLEATGRPLSEWHEQAPVADGPPIRPLCVAIAPPREVVYAACDARFDRMLQDGALHEVARLDSMGLAPDLPAMRAVGVRELLRHIRGELDLAEARHRAQTATRQYAKRQMTWIRNQMPNAFSFNSQFSERVSREIFPIIRDFLLTR